MQRLIPGAAGWLLFAATLLLQACQVSGPEEPVVATVGGEAITADEFTLSYELGFSSLKQGREPRRTYLEHMIDEEILAREGYRKGLDVSPLVQRKVQNLREKLLVEQVFHHEVNARVEVTDEEIERAIQEDQVEFKLRYLPAPTRQRALQLRRRAEEQGFAQTADALVAAERETGWRAEDFESPYLTRKEVAPAFFDAVAELEGGQFSEPIAYRGSYVILQVADVRRQPAGPAVAPEVRARYEQALFQREARQRAHEYIQATMQPVGLEIRPKTYRMLRDQLWAWYQDAPPEGNLLHALEAADGSYVEAIQDLREEVLLTTRDDEWTVEAFLDSYPNERYPLGAETYEGFEGNVYDAMGLLLRDHRFIEKARQEGWEDDPEVQEKLARWTDKWVYQALLEQMADTVTISGDELEAYFEQHRAHYRPSEDATVALADVRTEVLADARRAKTWSYLPGVIQALRQRYAVEVNDAVLDTLTLRSAGTGPDAMIVEGHSGKPGYPMVDLHWGLN